MSVEGRINFKLGIREDLPENKHRKQVYFRSAHCAEGTATANFPRVKMLCVREIVSGQRGCQSE